MAYITTEEVRAIRNALKAEFGKSIKFSVRKRHYSSVNVTILKSEEDLSEYTKDRGCVSVNHHWLDKHFPNEVHRNIFKKIVEIIETAPGTVEGGREWFDNSDPMTDYFHTAFYYSLNIGRWDRPYEQL